MRTVQDIDRDISRVVDCLAALMMERKLAEHLAQTKQAHAAFFAEKAIEKAKKNDWETGNCV